MELALTVPETEGKFGNAAVAEHLCIDRITA